MNVLNGFEIPFKTKFIEMVGTYFLKTPEGFYKNCFIALRNEELYMYNDYKIPEEQRKLLYMVVLTPGVFIKSMKHISLDKNLAEIISLSKLYPIEIFVGGPTGNEGIQPCSTTGGNRNGVFTIFLKDESHQKKWMRKL
jgi:hypothetical protein